MAKISPTYYMVALLGLIAVVALAWTQGGWKFGLVICAALLWEFWTFLNQYPNDTITEVIQSYSAATPMVPWVFGFATGMAMASGLLTNIYLVGGLLYVQGHFFFYGGKK